MKKPKKPGQLAYICAACGVGRQTFTSRCPQCESYNTLITPEAARARGLPLPIGSGDAPKQLRTIRTGLVGLDEMASGQGGLVRGSCYILSGNPGAGKSTLNIQFAAHIAEKHRVVYFYLEEDETPIAARMERLGLPVGKVLGVSADNIEQVLERVGAADVAILDSLVALHDRSGAASEEIMRRLYEHAHESGVTWIVINHVNKEGEAAGTKQTEHECDAQLELSGEKAQAMRVLGASKNRNGPTDRVRFFRMTQQGLIDVPDPASYMLADRAVGMPGSCVAATLIQDGRASVLVEVQALLTPIPEKVDSGRPARPQRLSAPGVGQERLRSIVTLLEHHAAMDLAGCDVSVKILACGLALDKDEGLDLPVALAVASAHRGVALPPKLCAWGELDLMGIARGAPRADAREDEAKRAGFVSVEGKKLQSILDRLLIAPKCATTARPAKKAAKKTKKRAFR